MTKYHNKKKKQKPFNQVRNGEKLQELRPKLKESKSTNNQTKPDSKCRASGRQEEQMFSKEDREIILHIRKLFSNNGKMAQYSKETNGIILSPKKDCKIYPLLISCCSSVLNIFTIENIKVNNNSNEVLKHVMGINYRMLMGGFKYNTKKNCFIYQLAVPLYEKPEKDFIGSLLSYTVDMLEDYVPEVISCTS